MYHPLSVHSAHGVWIGFIWFSKETASTSVNSINWFILVGLITKQCANCGRGATFLNKTLINVTPKRGSLKLKRRNFLPLCPIWIISLIYPKFQCLTTFLLPTHSWLCHQWIKHGSEKKLFKVDVVQMMVFRVLNPHETHSVTLKMKAAYSSEILEQSHYTTRNKNPEYHNLKTEMVKHTQTWKVNLFTAPPSL